jgi:glycosyltransferase involved in cell wall biosynthesis
MPDQKIKLLLVEPVSDLGGVSQFLLSLIRGLPRERFDIHLAASGPGPLFQILTREGVSVHPSRIDYSILTFLSALRSFRTYLKRESFDLIHAHTLKAAFLSVLANKNLPARVIYTGHGLRFTQKRGSPSKAMFFILERLICGSSDFVTVLSKTEYEAGLSKGLLHPPKARTIPMSIDTQRFAAVSPAELRLPKKQYDLPEDAFVVGMVGRLSSQKDPETFVRVAAIVSARLNQARFLWVGDGDLRTKIVRMADTCGVAANLRIAGNQEAAEIPKFLSMMDAFLFTSRYEGLPIALLEAMAANKLIVAADVGSVRDLIQEGVTGWLFRAGDSQHAASKIIGVYEEREQLKHIGEAAAKLVAARYSPGRKMSEEFRALYEEVVSQS